MSDDRLAAVLAAIRERADSASDIRRLTATVEAVLALHAPESRGRVMSCCAGCEDACEGDRGCHEWPCPTVEAVTAALTGEEDSGG